MLNNAPLIMHLGESLQAPETPTRSRRYSREKLSPEPCLLERLPTTAFIQREAEQIAPKTVLKQLRRTPTPPPESEDEDVIEEDEVESDSAPQHTRRPSITSVLSSISSATSNSVRGITSKRRDRGPWKDPQPYEVFRAVEQKDVMFLMEIRDRAFHLLLRKTGDATPLLHAMRIGQSHQDVAILLLGAFSRFVNQLQDDEIVLPKTKMLLKALRANLKLAIDFGLQSSQSDLIASFLQTLIMSEGDKWVQGQVSSIALALRSGTQGKPVSTAETAVRSFATRELGKARSIAALEDYVANATADLVMMAAWSWVLDTIPGDPIPSYYFARDDRVYRAFIERLDRHSRAVERTLGRRLRWQLRVLRKVMEGRTTNYRQKVEMLTMEFDEGTGV